MGVDPSMKVLVRIAFNLKVSTKIKLTSILKNVSQMQIGAWLFQDFGIEYFRVNMEQFYVNCVLNSHFLFKLELDGMMSLTNAAKIKYFCGFLLFNVDFSTDSYKDW